MQNELIDKVVRTMAVMYGMRAEIVVSSEVCFLFLGVKREKIILDAAVVQCLFDNEIIEQDGGCNEDGHVEETYVLTDDSQARIKTILDNKNMLLLKS